MRCLAHLAWFSLLLMLSGVTRISSGQDETTAPKASPETTDQVDRKEPPSATEPADPDASQEQPEPTAEGDPSQPLAGHSVHGEAFNEGPRQRAYLMDGMSTVSFPVTSEVDQVQAFIEQGVAQLHGFWYFEAERSFRQAAALDPDCAMAYWGMAMANANNDKRGKSFIAEAVERKEGISRREQMYIDALNNYLQGDKSDRKKRVQAYIKALEKLIYEFPDDLEARALLALQLWNGRSAGVPITSHVAVDAIIDQVFAVNPMHAAHHYRIHLWDYERPENALASAALCGQSSPGIAHMWHMPGHIYSRVKRYGDAAWQQEASARVDHAHMMRDRVMPDQIHNFAHNNEWLIRNLIFVGRIEDAVDLAKNMIELPQHPKYNTISRRGSAHYGRLRLFELLEQYELWPQTVELCRSPYLAPTDDEEQQIKRLRHLGSAFLRMGDEQHGSLQLDLLKQRLAEKQGQRDEAVAAAEEKARQEQQDDKQVTEAGKKAGKPMENSIRMLEKAVAELEGHLAVQQGDLRRGLEKLREAGDVEPMYLAHLQLQLGEIDEAVKAAQARVKSHTNEVQPLAWLVYLLWQADRRDEAARQFDALRELSSDLDLDSPVFERLAPIAAELELPGDWRIIKPPAPDTGDRPHLDALGPFRWSPSPAPDWVLKDASGNVYSSKQYRGRPLIVIFYLGYGCLHCAEQLQAFAPMTDKYRKAGFEVVAISTDDVEGLKTSLANYSGEEFPFPLVSNVELDVFKAYRAYDDFEHQPLHGTFVIDAQGLVRWQDISYEPFMQPDFVLQEAQRLLAQSASNDGS